MFILAIVAGVIYCHVQAIDPENPFTIIFEDLKLIGSYIIQVLIFFSGWIKNYYNQLVTLNDKNKPTSNPVISTQE